MKERQHLKNSILLCAESDGAIFKRTFTIVKKLDEGASSLCYEAYHEHSGRGVLKEFYPQDAYALERAEDGQLVHSGSFKDAHERFLQAEKEYIEPYRMLLDARQSSADQDLSTCIPAFEIYHGCDQDGRLVGTTYVWTPEAKVETFATVCAKIHRQPGKNPEQKLVTVLTAVESLTKCIYALHKAEMIHRDIKPANFGFVKRGNETLTQTLSLFDINSICSVYSKTAGVVGTKGYLEPEAGYEAANNQTDIYAIGATLFQAIIITEETRANGHLYQAGFQARLGQMVDESLLIQASEANSHPRLRNILTLILQKCLSTRSNRYANCEELLADLKIALYYALPSELAQKSLAGEKWVLADIEKSLDVNKEKNSFLAIQYHMYEHPLYQCSSNEDETINVLLIGFGNYGQKFLDACLQNGQIRQKTLHVTVVSDDLTDKEIYLAARPELADFFNIDGSLAGQADTYGEVSFASRKLERDNQAANTDILQDIMCEQHDRKCPHYVFIALGEDKLNRAAADACKIVVEVFEMACLVSYVCEGRRTKEGSCSILRPLHVNEDIKKSALYPEIERMAFNTHLVWEKNLNVDYKDIKADFRKNYNHDSSVSSVLALKYKLHKLGIDLTASSFNEAAGLFNRIITDKKHRTVKNELVWLEHRRWVTEKLCLGWRRIKDLEASATGITKDEKGKRHVCILRSRPDQKLTTEYRANNHEKWDKAAKSELDQLDELDRMSVELHRIYAARARKAKKQNLLAGSNMAAIKSLIAGDRKAFVAFQEWFSCLRDIWNGDLAKVRLYKGLKTAFLDAADQLSEERKKSVNEQVRAFESIFYPVLASMEYRDWKQDDVALIDNIPFILTYTENAYLVIPYAGGDNTAVFGNLAAATVVNPARILYLCLVEHKEELEDLKRSVPYVIEYMNKKLVKAAVEYILICTANMADLVNTDFSSELVRLGAGRIRQVKKILVQGTERLKPDLAGYLKRRSSGKALFALEKNTTRLSYLMQGAGLYHSFASYQFDSTSLKFHDLKDCDMLGYIKKKPYITVADMAAFRLSASQSSNQPEFFADFKELWDKYSENSGLWKLLCYILGEHAKKSDLLASFRKKSEREKQPEADIYRYVIPFVSSDSASRIIKFLQDQKILEAGSRVNVYTSASCELVIIDRCGYRAEYDKLFAQVYALMQADAITIHLNTKSHEVNVIFDNLMVTGLPTAGGRMADLAALMGYFQEKGYILGLAITPEGLMSFTYATRQIKELLTAAGKMLEVYTYHKIKELGRFDDVVSSFELDWAGTEVTSEFDCILTKGFRTLFVECKARPDIEQESYFKLASLAEHFGINARAVLIADTQERSFYDHAPINAMQRKRGNMMDVVTIWRPDEIRNIGHTLLKVINGNYISTEE